MCLTPLSTISVIAWWSVLLVEEKEYLEKTTELSRHWQTLSHNIVSSIDRYNEITGETSGLGLSLSIHLLNT